MSARQEQEAPQRITITAPARLHMGFFDLGVTRSRRFGGIGVGLNEIQTRIEVTQARAWSAEGNGADRALHLAAKITQVLNLSGSVHIRLLETIPEHAGLGSGTQLTLAVGLAIARLHGLDLQVRDIAALLDRGARSGIGIGVFEQGGLIVDGGRGANTTVPPLLARLELPDAWRFLLILDERDQGLSGSSEVTAFKKLPEFSESLAAHISHLILMQALPAVTENDLPAFGAAISEIQALIGDHFAPAQGGGRYTSAAVERAMRELERLGATAIGQSSWGPTGFCMIESSGQAESLLQAMQNHPLGNDNLRFMIASARNRGADINS